MGKYDEVNAIRLKIADITDSNDLLYGAGAAVGPANSFYDLLIRPSPVVGEHILRVRSTGKWYVANRRMEEAVALAYTMSALECDDS